MFVGEFSLTFIFIARSYQTMDDALVGRRAKQKKSDQNLWYGRGCILPYLHRTGLPIEADQDYHFS
jgi:hypothetical protein